MLFCKKGSHVTTYALRPWNAQTNLELGVWRLELEASLIRSQNQRPKSSSSLGDEV